MVSLVRVSAMRACCEAHIIGAFVVVLELLIFRDELVEKSLEIARRGIFHCDQTATGVLDKHRDRSVAHAALVDLTLNLVCDFVGALAVCIDDKIRALHSHSRRAYAARGRSATILPGNRTQGFSRYTATYRCTVDLSRRNGLIKLSMQSDLYR